MQMLKQMHSVDYLRIGYFDSRIFLSSALNCHDCLAFQIDYFDLNLVCHEMTDAAVYVCYRHMLKHLHSCEAQLQIQRVYTGNSYHHNDRICAI